METAWSALVRAGVPCAEGTPTSAPDVRDVAGIVASTERVVRDLDRLDERRRVSLLAWLSAWQSAFAPSFERAFGSRGPILVATVRATVEDADRYLKLRRIAREKLLAVL